MKENTGYNRLADIAIGVLLPEEGFEGWWENMDFVARVEILGEINSKLYAEVDEMSRERNQ